MNIEITKQVEDYIITYRIEDLPKNITASEAIRGLAEDVLSENKDTHEKGILPPPNPPGAY